jgi:hypothetical protein
VPSISGKTIGTSSLLAINLWVSAGTDFNGRTGSLGVQNNTIDIWGVQAEAGSTMSSFQTATGTLQGELAACERYYQVVSGFMATGAVSTTVSGSINFRTQMRVAPSLAASAAMGVSDTSAADFTQSSANATIVSSRASVTGLQFSLANFTGLTVNRPYSSIETGRLLLSSEL